MANCTLIRRILSRGGLLLALAVVVCLNPSSVDASCGDYVIQSAGRHEDRSPQADYGPHRSMPHKHAPCRGPNCSERKSLPPSNAPTTLRLSSEQWAVMPDALRLDQGEISVCQPDPELRSASCQLAQIFRPPR